MFTSTYQGNGDEQWGRLLCPPSYISQYAIGLFQDVKWICDVICDVKMLSESVGTSSGVGFFTQENYKGFMKWQNMPLPLFSKFERGRKLGDGQKVVDFQIFNYY